MILRDFGIGIMIGLTIFFITCYELNKAEREKNPDWPEKVYTEQVR